MAQTSYPFDGQSVTENQYSQLFREFTETGVAASADSLSLKVSGDGGGMRVFVQAGFAVVRGHAYSSTAVEQLTIGASTSQPRIDRVVLRLDPSVNSIVLAVKAGTPAASPSAPALTQTDSAIYELSLGQVLVGANVTSIASGAVTDERIFNGVETSDWSTSTRPAVAREGKLGYNRTTKIWEYWNGTAWGPIVPEIPIGSIIMYGNSAPPAGWHLCDGSAHGSSALQAAIGSANTPDLRSRFIVGAGSGPGLTAYAHGATGGAESVTLTAAQSGAPAHGHSAYSGGDTPDHAHNMTGWRESGAFSSGGEVTAASFAGLNGIAPYGLFGTSGATQQHAHPITVNGAGAVNASQAHENRPAFYALTFIIKKA